jgi:hypothetical protein
MVSKAISSTSVPPVASVKATELPKNPPTVVAGDAISKLPSPQLGYRICLIGIAVATGFEKPKADAARLEALRNHAVGTVKNLNKGIHRPTAMGNLTAATNTPENCPLASNSA